MKYLLDTNTCIRFINGRAPSIRKHILATHNRSIAISAIVKAEIYAGSAKSHSPEHSRAIQEEFFSRFTSLPFDDSCAVIYGTIRAYLEKQGTPIGGNDLLIASTALAYRLILVTHNTREFGRIPELPLEDWEVDHPSD